MILYFAFRDEADYLAADSTYSSKLDEQNVLQKIQANKSLIELHSDEVDHMEHVLSKHSEDLSIIFDPIGQQENADISNQMEGTCNLPDEDCNG